MVNNPEISRLLEYDSGIMHLIFTRSADTPIMYRLTENLSAQSIQVIDEWIDKYKKIPELIIKCGSPKLVKIYEKHYKSGLLNEHKISIVDIISENPYILSVPIVNPNIMERIEKSIGLV